MHQVKKTLMWPLHVVVNVKSIYYLNIAADIRKYILTESALSYLCNLLFDYKKLAHFYSQIQNHGILF